MPRFRPQFRLSTLLWITLAVGVFFGTEAWRWLIRPAPPPERVVPELWSPPERPEGDETLVPAAQKAPVRYRKMTWAEFWSAKGYTQDEIEAEKAAGYEPDQEMDD
jgi:hypothetical protein